MVISRAGQRTIHIPGIGIMSSRRGVTSAADWWAGGNVAYASKGAASYVASKVNVANPGTNDARDGALGPPTWNATTGWTFTRNFPWTYLYTDIPYTSTSITLLVRVANATQTGIIGTVSSGTLNIVTFGSLPYKTIQFVNGGTLSVFNQNRNSGVYGIAGNKAYLDGLSIGTIPTGSASGGNIIIGGVYENTSHFTGDALAFFYKDEVLDDASVAAISAAMAAL